MGINLRVGRHEGMLHAACGVRRDGIMAQRRKGAKGKWCEGAMVRRCDGRMSKVPGRTGCGWNGGIAGDGRHGIMAG
jgi:hypothetical protein